MLGDKSRNRKNKTGGINVENQKRAYFICGLAFIVVIAIVIWFACAGRSTVHDLRNGSNDIRNELESAQDRQREERQAVDTAADAADRSTEAVENSQRTTEEIKSIERTDRELIENCQRIIQRIRARGGTENQN